MLNTGNILEHVRENKTLKTMICLGNFFPSTFLSQSSTFCCINLTLVMLIVLVAKKPQLAALAAVIAVSLRLTEPKKD